MFPLGVVEHFWWALCPVLKLISSSHLVYSQLLMQPETVRSSRAATRMPKKRFKPSNQWVGRLFKLRDWDTLLPPAQGNFLSQRFQWDPGSYFTILMNFSSIKDPKGLIKCLGQSTQISYCPQDLHIYWTVPTDKCIKAKWDCRISIPSLVT